MLELDWLVVVVGLLEVEEEVSDAVEDDSLDLEVVEADAVS